MADLDEIRERWARRTADATPTEAPVVQVTAAKEAGHG